MESGRFKALSAEHRALVAIAVLLDGMEASVYLENDTVHGNNLSRAAQELAGLALDLRMPYVGSLLRDALVEIG